MFHHKIQVKSILFSQKKMCVWEGGNSVMIMIMFTVSCCQNQAWHCQFPRL